MKKTILIILLLLFPLVCFGQSFKNEREKKEFLRKRYSTLINPCTRCEQIQAYSAAGRSKLKDGQNSSSSYFWKAIENYVYYLYESRNHNIKDEKAKCPILQWIEDLCLSSGKDAKYKYLDEIKSIIVSINEKDDDFWKNLNNDSYRKFVDSLEKKWFTYSLRRDNTCYELVEGYLSLGEELLASGKRKEAKVAFLRALNERLIVEEELRKYPWSCYLNYGRPEDIEKIYTQYGQGKEDGDYKQIMELYNSLLD